jgi:hypothetical protein
VSCVTGSLSARRWRGSILMRGRCGSGAAVADVADVTSAIDAAQAGFARLPWRACNEEGERILTDAAISIRCVTTPEGTVPDTLDAEDLVAIAARAY